MVSSLINALGGEGFSLHKISIKISCKQVACSVVVACFVYPLFFILYFVVACLLFNSPFLYWCCSCSFTYLSPFFVLKLFLYFCLLIDHVNKPIIFVFGDFGYNIKKTISIFVTICPHAVHCIGFEKLFKRRRKERNCLGILVLNLFMLEQEGIFYI